MTPRLKNALIAIAALVIIGAAAFTLGRPASAPTAADAAPAVPMPGPGEPDLDAVRAATAKYRDVNVALSEGYIRDPFDLCDTADMMGRPAEDGAMGVHYFRPDLLGITAPPNPRVSGGGTHTDFLQPAILIYEPQADRSLELVAIENLTFIEAWRAAGHTAPPTFHGVAYDHMLDNPATEIDEAHMFAEHYDRHVWLYRENPRGIFAPFNPNVSCGHHTGATHAGSSH